MNPQLFHRRTARRAGSASLGLTWNLETLDLQSIKKSLVARTECRSFCGAGDGEAAFLTDAGIGEGRSAGSRFPAGVTLPVEGREAAETGWTAPG